MSKNAESAGVSPYTGVRITFVHIRQRDPDNPKEYIELFSVKLNLNTEGKPQFAERLCTPNLKPGEPVPY